MNYFQQSLLGLVIWDRNIYPALCEIRHYVERMVFRHRLPFSVNVEFEKRCLVFGDWYGSLSVVFSLPNGQMVGMVEYVSDQPYPDGITPCIYHFRWNSSTTTRIPGDNETLEEHVRRIIEI